MRIHSPTPRLTLLVAAPGSDGLMRVFDDGTPPAGFKMEIDPKDFLQERVVDACRRKFLIDPHTRITICQDFWESLEDGSSLLLVQLEGVLDGNGMITVPELMRRLPPNRQRLPYLKAWQILMGGLEQKSKVISVEEALRHWTTEDPS